MRFLVFLLPLLAGAADYDILIRNARVVDGSGNAWFRADVGVKGDRIAAVGRLPEASADRVIDAGGRILAPGFIDVHTHIEGGIEKVPRADNYVLDGVTTVVTGNCGGSQLNLADWFRKLEENRIGLNVASLIGHNTVRSEIMGAANRKANPQEIAMMQALIEKAMREGAVGFSTGLIYIPGTYSDVEEVVALAKAAGKFGGVYASHMRDEGKDVLDAINEAVRAGREGGLRVQLSHFKIDNRRLWGASDQSLALVEKYRREGVDVVVDQYPYEWSATNLGIRLPSWALADGKVKERLADPATRKKIATEMEAMVRDLGQPDYEFAVVARFAPEPKYEGKSIPEITAMKKRTRTLANQIETIFDLMNAGGASMIYHSMGGADVERIMKWPFTSIASDGGVIEFGKAMPHPRAYGTNARVLAEYVRDRGTLTLEDAIRRMTSLPARTFGFRDRGLVREGMIADLVLFDPARIADKATFQNPHQYTEGFEFVLINGKLAVDNGKMTEARSGRALRRQ